MILHSPSLDGLPLPLANFYQAFASAGKTKGARLIACCETALAFYGAATPVNLEIRAHPSSEGRGAVWAALATLKQNGVISNFDPIRPNEILVDWGTRSNVSVRFSGIPEEFDQLYQESSGISGVDAQGFFRCMSSEQLNTWIQREKSTSWGPQRAAYFQELIRIYSADLNQLGGQGL